MLHLKELDTVLPEIMARWDIPGLVVGIVQSGEIVYAKGLGVQCLKTQAPVTPNSIFCVQSVSKCFVATAVMQMAESAKLDLDTPLVQYLPYFRLDDDRYPQITVRQALSHTSGMPDMDEIEYVTLVMHPEFDEGAPERFVRKLADRKLVSNPGECFSYSNIAYNVLGDLLAKVSGKTFENLMQEQVLNPADMPNSTFMFSDVPASRLAWPHLRSPSMSGIPSYPYHRADAPASFLHTTVLDMCHWAITSLNRGTYLGQRLLSSAAYDLMWTPVAERSSQRPSLYEQMGLGWNLGHWHSTRIKTVSHGGGGFGGTSFLLILPEKNCAAVVLCNEESNAHFRVVRAVADTLIGQEPHVNTVSWMVPISRALAQGGLDVAYIRYAEIKECQDKFYFDENDLLGLSLELFTAQQIDLAVQVLDLNIHVFPENIESYLLQAKLYLHKGEVAQANECLLQALSMEPDNTTAASLLNRV